MSFRVPRIHLLSLLPWFTPACSPSPPIEWTNDPETTDTADTPETSPSLPTSTGETPSTSSTSDTTDATTSPQTTGLPDPEGVCGDGTLDDGEGCDNGAANRDDGPCTLNCKQAVCGDGLVWTGVETCDQGTENNADYSGCSPTCEPNATCGDSVIDVPFEQCDNGPANGTGQSAENKAPCTVGCRWDARVAFTSSIDFTGDLNGLAGADDLCRSLAMAAGLDHWHTFMAWLSDGQIGPLDRFILLPARPYVLPTGERIADSLSDLVLDGPGAGIRVDELGKPLPPQTHVWTNTSGAGLPSSTDNHCSAWHDSSPEPVGSIGLSHVPHLPEDVWMQWQAQTWWTGFTNRPCDATAHLYCFAQN